MANFEFTRIGREGDDTQFLVESRPDGLWSGSPEITIVREFKGKRDHYGPSIPVDVIPELLIAITTYYKALQDEQRAKGI